MNVNNEREGIHLRISKRMNGVVHDDVEEENTTKRKEEGNGNEEKKTIRSETTSVVVVVEDDDVKGNSKEEMNHTIHLSPSSENDEKTKTIDENAVERNKVEEEENGNADAVFIRKKERINVGGIECQLINDDAFSKLRKRDRIPFDFLKDFDFERLGEGGGKGGSKLAFHDRGRYVVKNVQGGDVDSLNSLADRLSDHILSAPKGAPSFISTVYAHFVHSKDRRHYMVTKSVLPDVKSPTWDEIYDLKGCRDDKLLVSGGERVTEIHMRCWKVPYFCCLWACGATPQKRKSYYAGKVRAYGAEFFHLKKKDADDMIRRLERDVAFLDASAVMDYSLILGVRRCPLVNYRKDMFPKGEGNQPFVSVHNGTVWAYYAGIIDFLQTWNCTKMSAACLKACCAPKPLSTVPPPQYALQFVNHFRRKLSNTHGEALPNARPRLGSCPPPSAGAPSSEEDNESPSPQQRGKKAAAVSPSPSSSSNAK